MASTTNYFFLYQTFYFVLNIYRTTFITLSFYEWCATIFFNLKNRDLKLRRLAKTWLHFNISPVCLGLSLYVSNCLCLSLSVYIYLSIYICLGLSVSICPFLTLSVSTRRKLFMYVSVFICICTLNCLNLYLSVSVCLCLSLSASTCLSLPLIKYSY